MHAPLISSLLHAKVKTIAFSVGWLYSVVIALADVRQHVVAEEMAQNLGARVRVPTVAEVETVAISPRIEASFHTALRIVLALREAVGPFVDVLCQANLLANPRIGRRIFAHLRTAYLRIYAASDE
jgi:hypothetical protein